MTRNCLDLFAGLGGFSAAFRDTDGWDVTTVEIDPEFDPDIQADVFDLTPSDFEQEFDVILASPPCTDFSPVAWSHEKRISRDGVPQTDDAKQSVALAHHAFGLVKGLAPDWWFVENPRGALRWVVGDPVATIDYCAYGHYTKKPTDLWGRHPPSMDYRRCPHGTHTDEDGITDFERGPSDASERAHVPRGVSEAILEAVENPAPETRQLRIGETR